jgi:dTDP-4-amino-4,6-dideoxygalactose transaminase
MKKIFLHKDIRFIKPYWGIQEFLVIIFVKLRFNFEKKCRRFIKTHFSLGDQTDVILTSSGRSAIHLCLYEIKRTSPKKKVIIPSYCCKGVLDPVVNLGLEAVFVDCDESLQPDRYVFYDLIKTMEDVLACVWPYLCGNITSTDDLKKLATDNHIAWIDDYCQGYSSTIKIDKKVYSVFSFGIGKNLMATAGGAAIIPSGQSDVKLLRENDDAALRRFIIILYKYIFNIESIIPKRLKPSDDISCFLSAYNLYYMSKLDMALLSIQLSKETKIVNKRKQNAERIGLFTNFGGLQNKKNLFTKFPVFVDSKTAIGYLISRGIECEGMYIPLHIRFSQYCYSRNQIPYCENLMGHIFNIPVRPNLKKKQVAYIANVVGAQKELFTHALSL